MMFKVERNDISENFHKGNNGKGRKMLMNMMFHDQKLKAQ